MEQNEQTNEKYDNLFEFLDNPNHPTPDPAPTASNDFLKRQHLKAHYPYLCAHCARKYLTEYAMKRHMSQLQVHGLTHIPKLNYKWPVCKQSFPNEKSVDSMMKHYRACSSFECHQGSCQLKFGGFLELDANLTKDHLLDKLEKWKRSWQSLVVHFHFEHFEDEKNLQSDPSSSSNSVSDSSSASSSESEQNDKTTGTLSPDLQQYQ
ncbi:hypothetical protein CAEBREN_00829 [Caenorhabditis brenneri]|uniref:C2H2-type domain-containing protein n=1 Tax=Caenorhabditis brenneri TaxID=135651 RepID=G0NGI9_CAEBE|nr:hypothetical protein CAEBREN_00829 [Caenorhabditis brenneri]